MIFAASLCTVPASAAIGATRAATDPVVAARVAFTHRERATLARLRGSTAATAHPLAMWIDYWDLSLRLREAKQADLEAFYSRWPGTLVEVRLRREWIIERGKQLDATTLDVELPRVQRFDDRERSVECYALLQRHGNGERVAQTAREAWFAQREADHGCAFLATTLFQAGQLTREDVWARARLAAEQGKRFTAQHAIGLLGTVKDERFQQAFQHPSQFLARRHVIPTGDDGELAAFAIIRLAMRNPPAAAAALEDSRWAGLPQRTLGAAWAMVAREAAIGLNPQAFEWYQRAAAAVGNDVLHATPDTLAWKVRAALRAENSPQRWHAVVEAVDAMGDAQRADPTWTYWKARALQATAPDGPAGHGQRLTAKRLLERITTRLHYYGMLAAAELGQPVHMPATPPPLTDTDVEHARNNPGLARGLLLMRASLREEGYAEWRHALRDMNDRSLRAAAQIACDARIWTLCMTTSERTRDEIDMAQRFPTPYREQVEAAANETGIDAARLYAVIRQESHFNVKARSVAGAAGLMQLMPQTARWVASRYRIPFKREYLHEPAINVRIGALYLRQVLREFDGSHVHAAAAYNAGPSRPRRWSRMTSDDMAVWTEIIPIAETRDYVKHVLANAAYYDALIGNGLPIHPRPSEVPHTPATDAQTTVATRPLLPPGQP